MPKKPKNPLMPCIACGKQFSANPGVKKCFTCRTGANSLCGIKPKKAKPYRCTCGHKVETIPCLICAALKEKSK